MLSTIAAATAGYVQAHRGTPGLAAYAAVHGYSTAFWCVAGLYGASAPICLLLFPGHHRTAAHS